MRYITYLLTLLLVSSCGQRSGKQDQQNSSLQASVLPFHQYKVDNLPDQLDLFKPLIVMRNLALQTLSGSTDLSKNDLAFLTFRRLYSDSIQSIGFSLFDNRSFQKWIAAIPQDSLKSIFNSAGFTLAWSEGSAFVEINTRYLLTAFGPYLSYPMLKFLVLQQNDEEQKFTKDAALLISWDELSERIATWETFITENPNFLALDEAKDQYTIYLDIYLTGIDNSPLFSFESKTLDNAVKQSYLNFIKQHPETRSAQIVKGFLEVLRRNNYMDNRAVQEYLKKTKIGSTLG